MSLEREWRFRIEHIVEAIEKIMRYTAAMSYEQFAADERTVDAVIRNFLVIVFHGDNTGSNPVWMSYGFVARARCRVLILL